MRNTLLSILLLLSLTGCTEGRGEPSDPAGDAQAPVPQAVSEETEHRDSSVANLSTPRSLEELPSPNSHSPTAGSSSSDVGMEGEGDAPSEGQPPDSLSSDSLEVQEIQDPGDGLAADGSGDADARFPKPDHVRGIYLNAWTAGSPARRRQLIDLARRTELNTFVIDIKDVSGFVSIDTKVPLAREVGAADEIRIRDLPGLLNQLEEAGIYPIARIVVAKDPLLSAGRPDLAIQDSAGGAWLDQNEVMWLNFHNPEVWQYHLDLAQEVADAGFPEIQWDYVRFPDAPEAYLSRAVFPGSNGRSKTEAVRLFLGYTRDMLGAQGVRVTADVFGVTTSYRRDVGIGQLWESFIDQVDAALPMVYPSHYWTGSFGIENPNAFPYEIVRRALRDAMKRSALVEGAGATRPWLQDFSLGDPPYGSPEVRAQIQATYDAGIQEWVLWNPGSRYTEDALIPARGLPSWLEPVMRVGGEVVPLSQRFEVLGEEGDPAVGAPPLVETPDLSEVKPMAESKPLPALPLPDTGRVVRGGLHR